MTMMQEWEASVHHLVYHFRTVIRGFDPFSAAWEVNCENQWRGGLDDEAAVFMRKVKDLLSGTKGIRVLSILSNVWYVNHPQGLASWLHRSLVEKSYK